MLKGNSLLPIGEFGVGGVDRELIVRALVEDIEEGTGDVWPFCEIGLVQVGCDMACCVAAKEVLMVVTGGGR